MEFKLISIASIIAFYGCYFLKMFHQKRQGIQTDQIGKDKIGFVKFVEITMKIAAILVFIAGLVSIFLETGNSLTAIRIIGAITSVGGTVIFIVALWTMRDSWRAGVSKTDKTELITNGIYHISRNPAFLGFDLLYIGTLLMFFNWILCFLTVFAVIMYHLQIVNVEENFLLVAFGNEYLQYKKKVCRYVGRRK
ncbi:isoprenylcysteine carboxylmethyltransferase family protein [Parablautia intestinalis]|uniref:Isoprenylcysteine carboxylmethyltransferase family protein n=1 Tax=Parablautia intestinalis TaxID=2320100 RepID=A0A3A9AIY0_9FIRM|nr:isoprenylcysteine carboxylmethyltransferase family protein [Parablautia intestinalis]RKI91258.1 isoprenylcysteine carboxylmethyltransferase family protein [Parablautia intestinalis]